MQGKRIPPPGLSGNDLIEWARREHERESARIEATKSAIVQAVAYPNTLHSETYRNGSHPQSKALENGSASAGLAASTQRPQNCVLSHRQPVAADLLSEPKRVADSTKSEAKEESPSSLMQVEGFLPKSEDELCERIGMLFAPGVEGFSGEEAKDHEIELQIVRMLAGFFEGDRTKALDFASERLADFITVETAESIWPTLKAPAWALEKALGFSRQDWDHPYLCGSLHHRSRTRQLAQTSYLLQKMHGPNAWFLLNQKTLATLLQASQQDIARMLSNLVRIGWIERRKRHGSRSLEYQCLGHLQELEDDQD